MARKPLIKVKQPTVKLTKKAMLLNGPKKNGLFLLDMGVTLAKLYEMDYHKIESEMKAKDYKHLLKTFRKYFKDYVDFEIG